MKLRYLHYLVICGFVCFFLSYQPSLADVKLPKVLSSNMVLQRNIDLKIWGWADRGEKVTIQFNQQEMTTKARKDGSWQVVLKPMKAGGPFAMTISGKNKIELSNILIGDVWICSGQSNMEWSLTNTNNADEEIQQANHENIRLFTAPKAVSNTPSSDLTGGEWKVCSSESIPGFSAVGYFFGRHLNKEMDVPIGLINTSWGGTNIETWTSSDALKNISGFEEPLSLLKNYDAEAVAAQRRKKVEAITGPLPDQDQGMSNGVATWADPTHASSSWETMELPQLWETAGMEGLDGVVWFKKTFDLSEAQAQKGITLHLGPIDDSDTTWVNGKEVGRTEGYNIPRVYKVASSDLKAGTNTLVIRVTDSGGGGGIYGEPEDLILKTGEKDIPLTGLWNFKVGMGSFNQSTNPNSLPALLYNAMIHPIINYGISGSIWYQGESNAGRAHQYRTLFPNMIQDWRNRWQQGNTPFFFVQLANFTESVEVPSESTWAELREAQLNTLGLSNTGMAVIIDIGEADDIHPRNKQDVGHRLALSALKVAHDQDIVHSGPIFKSIEISGSEAHLTFDHVGNGLKIKDRYGYLKGFAIAGADRKFHWGQARLEDNKVVVSCDQVPEPVAVRYGWADNPDDINLYNEEDLPASPFRTDRWPGITQGKVYEIE